MRNIALSHRLARNIISHDDDEWNVTMGYGVLSSTSPQSSICWTELKKRLLLVLKKVSYSFWLRDTATQHRERSNHRCIDSSMICFAPGQFRGEIILEIFFCCALFHKDGGFFFFFFKLTRKPANTAAQRQERLSPPGRSIGVNIQYLRNQWLDSIAA